jgi:RNA polymerase sigma-70 factor (ECF subfamily)
MFEAGVTEPDDADWTVRCAEAAARHGDWGLDAESLTAAIGDAWPDGPPAALRVEDAALAFACGRGNERAVAEFLRRFGAIMRREAAKVDSAPTFVADANARLRERLLSPRRDAPPRIATYQGRGALADWVRVAAARNALNLARDSALEAPARGDAIDQIVVDAAPELRWLAERHRDDLNEAVRFAFTALATEERNILRMHYVDDVAMGELGALYGVHKSTMSRRVARARDAVLTATCERLAQLLEAPPADVANLIKLLRSQIDVTLSRVLASRS